MTLITSTTIRKSERCNKASQPKQSSFNMIPKKGKKIKDLPLECMKIILNNLNPKEIHCIRITSKEFHYVSNILTIKLMDKFPNPFGLTLTRSDIIERKILDRIRANESKFKYRSFDLWTLKVKEGWCENDYDINDHHPMIDASPCQICFRCPCYCPLYSCALLGDGCRLLIHCDCQRVLSNRRLEALIRDDKSTIAQLKKQLQQVAMRRS